jgi:hypothetical protein
MILRISTKLGRRLRVTPRESLALDPNPFADWSVRDFTVERLGYILVTHTTSLYSAVLPGRGIADESRLIEEIMSFLREILTGDGFGLIFQRRVVPSTVTVSWSKALNRSVTGSMNDLVVQAQHCLIGKGLSPYDTSFRLNQIPMGALDYGYPRKAFEQLIDSGLK